MIRVPSAVITLIIWSVLGTTAHAQIYATDSSAPATVPTEQKGSGEDIDQALLDQERNADVVTASGMQESRALAAANVYTVTYEEIMRRGYKSLGEILASVPGIYLADDGVIPSVSVRGVSGGLRAGTRLIKVMINGVPISFRPDLTAFLGPEFIPIEMIDQVEVAKGPLSSLYGANAFLATANIITRGQLSTTNLVAEASARSHVGRASPGYGGTMVAGFDDKGRSLLVSASVDRIDRSGMSVQKTFAEQNSGNSTYSFLNKKSEDDLSQPMSLYAQYILKTDSVGRFMLQGGIQRLDSVGEFQINSIMTHKSRIALENDWASVRHQASLSSQVSTNVWLEWSRGMPTQDEILYLTGNTSSAYMRNFMYHSLDGAAEISFSPLKPRMLDIKVGGDFSNELHHVLAYDEVVYAPVANSGISPGAVVSAKIPQGDPTKITIRNAAGYLQVATAPFESGAWSNLRLTGNYRLDAPSLFPVQHSFRLAAAYLWNQHLTTKLIAGRAFQIPSAVLLYGQPGFGTTGNVSGNRISVNQRLSGASKLEPQKVQSVELVTLMQISKLSLDLSFYVQRMSDLIEFQRAGSDYKAANLADQTSGGIEISAMLPLGRLSFQFGGTLQRVFDTQNTSPLLDTSDFTSGPPPLLPTASGTLAVNLALPEIYLNGNVAFRGATSRSSSQANELLSNGPYTLNAYGVVDLTLSTLGLNFLGGTQTTFTVRVRNLLDQKYSEPGFGGFDIPAPGRTLVAELKQSY